MSNSLSNQLNDNDNEDSIHQPDEDDDSIIQQLKNDEDNDDDFSDSDSQNEDDEDKNESLNEEQLLQSQIEDIDFNSLLKAKAKMKYQDRLNANKDTKKKSKGQIREELKLINKNKDKSCPREYSALIKPKFQFKNTNNSQLLGKKFHRDPRFDDLSGKLNETSFNKNYSFVKDMAKDYVKKIKNIKTNKKYKKKLNEESYQLLKKQNNFVKGWLNQQKQNESKNKIRREINQENKKRMGEGKKPIYVKKNKVKKYMKETENK